MRPKVLFFIFAITVSSVYVAQAETLTIWTEKLPGFRKALSLADLPERIFGVRVMSASNAPAATEDARLSAGMAKLATLPVTGLLWSDLAGERRVLMGDIVMREGQAIPSYVFNDKSYYILVCIGQDKLQFKMMEGNLENPVVFEVPFVLKESLKNESNFSTTAEQPQ